MFSNQGFYNLAFSFYLFFKIFIIFIFGCTGSQLLHVGFHCCERGRLSSCNTWSSHYSGFSCSEHRIQHVGASAVVARRLQSTGSVVVAHGLSCPAARGILPDRRLNLCPRQLAGGFLTAGPIGEVSRTLKIGVSLLKLCYHFNN